MPTTILAQVFDMFFDAVNGRPNTKGGTYRVNYLSTTCHVYFGSVTGATPDGRKAWEPLSDGISPVQGADRHGPDRGHQVRRQNGPRPHRRHATQPEIHAPSWWKARKASTTWPTWSASYFKLDGHHIQFNVVDAATLREAQEEPEKYRDLIVRVAGYSDYFCDLTPALQNEIIARTEQTGF